MEVASKDFHKQRKITDVFTIHLNKVVLSMYHAIMERTGGIL